MEAARLQTPQAGVGGGGICEAGGDAVTAESRSFLFSTGFSYAFFIYTSSLFPLILTNDVDRPTLSRSWKPRSLVSLKQKARRPSQRAVWSGVAGINRRESTNVEDVGCNLVLVAPRGPKSDKLLSELRRTETSPRHKRMRVHGKRTIKATLKKVRLKRPARMRKRAGLFKHNLF